MKRGLDFFREWAEGMSGDEEEAMIALVAVAEAARDVAAGLPGMNNLRRALARLEQQP